MTETRSPAPPLFSVEPGERPSLLGRRCADCGYVSFPPHDFGCEACGALPARTEPTVLAGAGVLRSFATVHRHSGPGIAAPFVVGEIELDAGPMVRCVIEGETALRIGDRMRALACSIPASADREAKVEVRFEKAAEVDR